MTKQLHVAFITTTYPRYPADPIGHFIAHMAEGVAAAGVRVSAWVPHEAGLAEEETMGGVEVHRFRYASDEFERLAYGPGILTNVKRDPRAALAFPGFVRAMRAATARAARSADVLHAHWAQNAFVAGAGRGPAPLVLTLHGSDVDLAQRPGFAVTLRRPVAQAEQVIAVSRALAREVAPMMPPGREPRVIHVGVDAALLGLPAAPVRPPGGTLRVMAVARLMRAKGVLELADALLGSSLDSHLTLVGVGPLRDEIARRYEAAGRAEGVTFTGALPHSEVLERMREVDLVVVPSHREGCGLVSIEAAAIGVPVIVTRTGAMPEVAGCAEAVVEPGDTAALAAAIERFAADSELRARCAVEGRARVKAEFTWDHIVDELLEVYAQAAATGGRS